MKNLLILVDVQNDFLPGGSLAVPGGDEILPVILKIIPFFSHVYATQDWHPLSHCSFAENHNKPVGELIVYKDVSQILWPVHCVQNSTGAEIHPLIPLNKIHKIIYKGTSEDIDSYSGFFDNNKVKSTGLSEQIKKERFDQVFICGLATDYCIKFTVLDALSEGFNTYVIEDACKGVNLSPDDSFNALLEMKENGAKIVQSTHLRKLLRKG